MGAGRSHWQSFMRQFAEVTFRADIARRWEIVVEPNEQGEAFGAWLLKQIWRDDWIGTLAKQAKADPRFRAAMTPNDLREKLQEAGAEGDSFEALDDAGMAWKS